MANYADTLPDTVEMKIAFAVSMARTANWRLIETGERHYIRMREDWISAARLIARRRRVQADLADRVEGQI